MTKSIGAKTIADLIEIELYYSVLHKMMDTFLSSCNVATRSKYFEIKKVLEQTVGLEPAPLQLFSDEFSKIIRKLNYD